MIVNRPAVLIDLERCRRNIQYMSGKAEQLGLVYRPHFKTHQSAEIGSWYQDAGVTAAAVSSAGMASYFHKNGWNDLTVAFPATSAQFSDLHQLAKTTELKIVLNDVDSARHYASRLSCSVGVFIEIDAGFGRTGVPAESMDVLEAIMSVISGAENLHFYGFYVHDGRTYQAVGEQQVLDVMEPVLATLQNLKSSFPDAAVCLGDTPSCSLLDTFPGVDEISPGNNIFYDLMQLDIGSCRQDDIAVAVACPVVQAKPSKNEVIIHGGAVHFSKESLKRNGKEIYGACMNLGKDGFGDIIEGCFLVGMSQEHGTLKGDPEWISTLKAGDTVCIFPVHSCLTANLHDHYQTLDANRIEKRILS